MGEVQKYPKDYSEYNPDIHLKKVLADLFQIIIIWGYKKGNAGTSGKIKISQCYKYYLLTPVLSHFTIKFRTYMLVKYYLLIFKNYTELIVKH